MKTTYMHRIVVIVSLLMLLLSAAGFVYAEEEVVGETVQFEGYVEKTAKNSMLVSGKILVANEYSSINTGGTKIFVGDYVMGFIYLNEDQTSYTIVSLAKVAEKSLGTPTPLPTATFTPIWADLFTATPTVPGSENSWMTDTEPEATEIVLPGEETNSNADTWDPELFGTLTPTPTIVPTPTPSSLTFEGIVSEVNGRYISINGEKYLTDNSTGYKDESVKPKVGDYVKGRSAPFVDATIIRFIEVVPDYERPDAKSEFYYGLYESQDKEKIVVNTPNEGEVTALFYNGTKMTKTFYTKGTVVGVETINGYIKSVTEYPLVQSTAGIDAINGVIDHILHYDDTEVYIISNNYTYYIRPDAKYIPTKDNFAEGKPFIGLIESGQVKALCFTDNNRVKEINGTVNKVDKSDTSNIVFTVGGIDYYLTAKSIFTGANISRNSEVRGYADSQNEVFYLAAETPWYSGIKDWNWSIIAPAALMFIALILFLLLHRTKSDGFLQEVDENIMTLTDAKGENKRHFICTDEIARFAGSLVTMKVEVTVYRGKVIHVKYDF